MKAAVFYGPGQDLIIEDVQIDDPQDFEVLIRTVGSGVCHSELHFVKGEASVATPSILGHEAAGVVERVGSRVSYVKPGDHVVARGTFCGQCRECLSGHLNRCTNRPGRGPGDAPRWTLNGEPLQPWGSNISGWAEYMLMHENGVVKIREEMPLDVASLLGCAVITGFGAVMRTAEVKLGSRVAVFGVGGIGLSAIQGAVIAGAERVIAVDLLDSKLASAKEFGATDTVNASTTDPVEAIRELTGGVGVDYSFDAIGLSKVAIQCIQSLAPGGTATLVGVIPDGQEIPLTWRMLGGEQKVQGCVMGSNRFRVDLPMLVELYLQGRLKLDEMVSRRGRLEDVNDMLEQLKSGEMIRQVMVMD